MQLNRLFNASGRSPQVQAYATTLLFPVGQMPVLNSAISSGSLASTLDTVMCAPAITRAQDPLGMKTDIS